MIICCNRSYTIHIPPIYVGSNKLPGETGWCFDEEGSTMVTLLTFKKTGTCLFVFPIHCPCKIRTGTWHQTSTLHPGSFLCSSRIQHRWLWCRLDSIQVLLLLLPLDGHRLDSHTRSLIRTTRPRPWWSRSTCLSAFPLHCPCTFLSRTCHPSSTLLQRSF